MMIQKQVRKFTFGTRPAYKNVDVKSVGIGGAMKFLLGDKSDPMSLVATAAEWREISSLLNVAGYTSDQHGSAFALPVIETEKRKAAAWKNHDRESWPNRYILCRVVYYSGGEVISRYSWELPHHFVGIKKTTA